MSYHYQESEPIILGSGELYLGTVNNPEEATEENIISALKNIGAIESGATLNYSPDTQELSSANRGVLRRFISKEEVTFNCGIMTWVMENLELLAPSTVTVDEVTGEKRIKIGGKNTIPVNYLRFIHSKEDGGELIINIAKAQSTSGFEFTFDRENPLTVGYEFSALSQKDGTLVEIVETFLQEENGSSNPED